MKRKIPARKIVLAEQRDGSWGSGSKERALGSALAPSSCAWEGRGRGVDRKEDFKNICCGS